MKTVLIILIVLFGVEAHAFYDNDYLEYDSYGLKQVNCMRCNVAIKKRTPRLVELDSGEEVYVESIKTLSNFEAVTVVLNNDSYTNALMCRDCKRVYQNTEEGMRGVAKQLRSGWVLEARGLKRPEKEIKAIEKRVKKIKVVKKLKVPKKRIIRRKR